MRWTNFLRDSLVPSFGGVPTFCEDPDGLVDVPEVREALRASGMTVGDWDGLPLSLVPLKSLADDAMPLLIAEAHAGRHIVESCLENYRWERVSVGQMMPKFAQDVVKAVPNVLWDRLLALHDEARAPRTPQETAILIARALYGVDPDFLRHGDGWFRLLVRQAAGDEPLPVPVARAVATLCPPPPSLLTVPALESLTSGSAARTALLRALDAEPNLAEQADTVERTLIGEMRRARPVAASPPDAADILAAWGSASVSPQTVLEFGRTFAEALARGLPAEVHGEINARFTEWLLREYGLIQTSPNPAVLRLPTLVRTLDAETSGKLLLVVIDALGLAAWSCVRDRWLADGVIGGAQARTALAVLPTITSLSRRALFEGKPPAQFSDKPHSQGLERKLWTTRFGNAGGFFTVDEAIGFTDSLAKGTPRIALLDVTWDKRGHSIDPRTDSIADAARTWAGRTPLRDMVRAGLAAGYRVILTADHGQTECWGRGRPNVGSLPEERSKRVILFKDKTVSETYATDGALAFRPAGLPQGMFPLFAARDASFDLPGVPSVSHGGLSLDEALVPVVEVRA